MDENRDSLFFVRQSQATRKDKAVFVLPVSGELMLAVRKVPGQLMRGAVVAVGQSTSGGSYAARAIRWILLRDCVQGSYLANVQRRCPGALQGPPH